MADIPDEAVEAACFAMHGPEWEEREDGFHVPSMRAALAAALPLMQSHGPDCELVDPHWLGEAKDKWAAAGYDECHDAYEARIGGLEAERLRLRACLFDAEAILGDFEQMDSDAGLRDCLERIDKVLRPTGDDRNLHEGSE